jgi:hypothetical protein
MLPTPREWRTEHNSIPTIHPGKVFTSTPPLPASGYRFENNELSGELNFSQSGGLNVPIIVKNNTAKSLRIPSGSGYTNTLTNNVLQDGYFDTSGANRTLLAFLKWIIYRLIEKSQLLK